MHIAYYESIMEELLGNEVQKEQFKNYIQHNQASNKPIFLILVWQEWIGKTTFLRNFAEENLWDYMKTDLFWMKDCSKVLWKSHSIQVETPDKQKTIEISENEIYDNKWIRELNSWLQQSSISWRKVVIIENLQRMTNSAMNAFLKTCEEPLSNRYILATAEHESWILPTILSRAMVIKFWSLSDSQMEEFVNKNYPDINWENKKTLIELSMGSPWTFHSVYTQMQEDEELLGSIQSLLSLMKSKWMWSKKVQLLKKMDEKWLFESIQNVLIKEYTENWDTQWVDALIRVKKLIAANVNQENALWDGVLAMDE